MIPAKSGTIFGEVKRQVSPEYLDCSNNKFKHDFIVKSVIIPPDRHGLVHYDVVRLACQSPEI